jgi:hypothetical protein
MVCNVNRTITDTVAIPIGAAGMGIHIFTETIAVTIVLRIHRAGITYIANAITVGIRLVRIKDHRAIITGIAQPIFLDAIDAGQTIVIV